jgi:hypothetical protein
MEPTGPGNFTLAFEITLVSNNDDWEIVLVLYTKNLLLELLNFFEALPRRDRVHEQESFAGAHVLFTHRRVFFLSGRVQYVEKCDLIIDHTLLAVRICSHVSAYVSFVLLLLLFLLLLPWLLSLWGD